MFGAESREERTRCKRKRFETQRLQSGFKNPSTRSSRREEALIHRELHTPRLGLCLGFLTSAPTINSMRNTPSLDETASRTTLEALSFPPRSTELQRRTHTSATAGRRHSPLHPMNGGTFVWNR